MSYLRDQDELRSMADELPIHQDETLKASHPALYDYLTLMKDRKGQRRQTATLTISIHDGAWKASLNDRHTGYSLFRTSDTFRGSIDALEAALTSEQPGWRQNWWQDNSKSKKAGK